MLSKEEVKKIAKLARLNMGEEEIDKYQKDLSAVLDFVEQLNEVDIEGVEPTFQITGLVDETRNDVQRAMTPEEKKKNREKLLSLAPDRKNNHIKVKKVL
ncbi:MAG: Asp-tRNA(Asn)/Glu-tRNA(Gln) amidotransferase GatCAB subunit C [Candidatus Portnoybacteria bacterium CG10_big_fil_rev_8_21_14_0_10_36_7]|uniref:Aspartyl/glutamyl-tRNA(Asn/Gln) amidotransferase subunit C n=1 Tax=Candidatus Portnoybacteria bacterium CG10_big_fil_rev_8_21_14_0_10_36_7 TaxID=1974812 RepID=A0A2M8KDM2_9BACT|nr:MAG: Asp-tRNA(Asn)/Glu-tRNA(Gln) amidotransferase GatCAB subunit C [Candidatus Portnoybacteria bacterium CG10_big_fil_rev_8_21_14_0_10_36_7]